MIIRTLIGFLTVVVDQHYQKVSWCYWNISSYYTIISLQDITGVSVLPTSLNKFESIFALTKVRIQTWIRM